MRLKRTPNELRPYPNSAPPPDEQAELVEQREQVLAVLRTLPEEYRLPLTLRYLAGADHDTIYVADGLTAEERERLERHVHGCGECHTLLAEQRAFDDSLGKLFASARPAAGFENRVLAGLRAEPLRQRVAWTKTWRWLGSAAAVLLLGVCGYGMHRVMETGSLPFPGEWGARTQVENNLKQLGLAVHGRLLLSKVREAGTRSDPMLPTDGDPVARELDSDINYNLERKSDISVPGAIREKLGKGQGKGQDGTSNTILFAESEGVDAVNEDRLEALKQMDSSSGRGEEEGLKADLKAAYRGIRLATPAGPSDGADLAKATVNLRQPQLDDTVKLRMKLGKEGGDVLSIAPVPNAVAFSPDGKRLTGDNPGGGGPVGSYGGGGMASKGAGAPAAPPGVTPTTTTASTPAPQGLLGTSPTMGQGPVFAAPAPSYLDANQKATNGLYFKVPVASALGAGPGGPMGLLPPDSKASGKDAELRYLTILAADGPAKGNAAKNGGEYFKEVWGHLPNDSPDKAKGEDKKESPAPALPAPPLPQLKAPAEGKPAQTQPISAQIQPDPKPVVRKIIRTGEVEFEIEGFDSAVASVTQLINGIPGGFIATVNSEKLPNGKVKGSVIVRMPPENLDKFLLDMRKELAKVGELKSQRIGSQDVTKQYYDLESRLRAARTMEERLIDIIKKGKGEIKDLLLAEKELGVWRTKIEEMEGEIRFYNNQVGLSTLTITLYEKELRAAAAMVITEHVNMKIEADDVEKSLQSALTAVTEAKGRVTKSDLKQHAAGQYEAILQFEVAPAAAGQVRDKLKTLGVVTHHDAQRLQQAEGGSTTKGEIKSRVSDVQFSVSLYNVANIKPREAYSLDIATTDVVADYRRLQDAVSVAKGQVRSSNLDEKDKLSISAQFEFDVPATARDTFDKLVNGLGDVLSKTTTRAAPGETATDRKVGYRLTLRSLTAVQPRESYKLDIATSDVSAEYRGLHDQISLVKGQVRSTNLNEADKLHTTAALDFDVPAAERDKFDKLLAGLGDTLTRNTIRAGQNEIATERKVGYRLTLRNLAAIQPREAYRLDIATPDVAADYRALQVEIDKVKGQVRAINLNELDKLNTTATLDFDVSSTERDRFDKLLKELGETLARNTLRVQPAETATDLKSGYRLTLRNSAGVQPRESYTLQTVNLDVPVAYQKLQAAVTKAQGHVRNGQLSEPDKLNVSAQFDFDVPVGERDAIKKLLGEVGEIYSSNTTRVAPNEVATERKVGYRLRLNNAAAMTPREKVTLGIQVKDVEQAAVTFKDMVKAKGGTVVHCPIEEGRDGRVIATLLFNVPLGAKEELVRKFKAFGDGKLRESKSSSNLQAAETKLATVHLDVILTNLAPIVPSDEGIAPALRNSMSKAFFALTWSVVWIFFGLAVVLPWALIVWIAFKIVKKIIGKTPAPSATTAG